MLFNVINGNKKDHVTLRMNLSSVCWHSAYSIFEGHCFIQQLDLPKIKKNHDSAQASFGGYCHPYSIRVVMAVKLQCIEFDVSGFTRSKNRKEVR